MFSKKTFLLFSIATIFIIIVVIGVLYNDRVLPEKVVNHVLDIGDEKTKSGVSDKTPHNPGQNFQKFIIEHDSLKTAVASPEYINDELVAFSLDLSEKSTSYIMVVPKGSTTFNQIYSTTNSDIINSLVGIDNKLFWVEYPRGSLMDTPWKIKSMELATNEVLTVCEGVSEDQMLPPVLRVDRNKLTWIEKKIENNIVISSAIVYEPKSNKFTEIATAKLDERNNSREGTFLIIQRPLADGMLIHQSIFKKGEAHINKSFEIAFYPYDSTTSPKVIKSDIEGIVDFTADDKWVVFCEIGRVRVFDRESGDTKYEIIGEDSEMTFDSPFIMNNKVYYRYSMNQIFALDLSTGKEEEVTAYRSIISKIYNSEGYLGFSFIEARENSGEIELYIIEESQ